MYKLKKICFVFAFLLCFVFYINICSYTATVIGPGSIIKSTTATTVESESTKSRGIKVEGAEYYDYVGYDDQGRLIDKNNIIIGKSETTIDDRTEEEKNRESKYEEALEIIRESEQESIEAARIQHMEDTIKRAEEIRIQQSLEAEISTNSANYNQTIESIREKILQQSREKESSIQESLKKEALSKVRAQTQRVVETENIIYRTETTTRNSIIQTVEVTQPKSVFDNTAPSIIVPQETVQLQTEKLSTDNDVVSIVILDEVIEDDINNETAKNNENIDKNFTKNEHSTKNNIGKKNLFTAIKDFFVGAFSNLFHKK